MAQLSRSSGPLSCVADYVIAVGRAAKLASGLDRADGAARRQVSP
jgi:hypothetical protein